MKREEAMRMLPRTYADALTLRQEGLSAEGIAERLGIVPEAARSLLLIAEAKLRTFLKDSEGDGLGEVLFPVSRADRGPR